MKMKLLQERLDTIKELEATIKRDKPFVDYTTAVLKDIEPISLLDWLDILEVDAAETIEWLMESGYFYNDEYFIKVPVVVATPSGNKESIVLKVTGEGQLMIGGKLK